MTPASAQFDISWKSSTINLDPAEV